MTNQLQLYDIIKETSLKIDNIPYFPGLTETACSLYSDSNNIIEGSCGMLLQNMEAKLISDDGD
ncbi:6189_t:CDS:2, partial [Gigaspora rosea]